MVDFAATDVQAMGVAPHASREGGQTKGATAKPLIVLPPPSTGGVDGLHRQLVEIHAIAATQLAECAHWCRSNPTSNAAHIGADGRGPAVEPSSGRTVPSTDFSPQA
jgi:hypothetical protein